MKPTLTIYPFSNKKITLFAYGKPRDWSLRSFNNGTVSEQECAKDNLAEAAITTGAKKILLPFTSEFTGRMADKSELHKKINLKEGITLLCGGSAEGVEIQEGEAFALNIADCQIIAVYEAKTGRLFGAHAGRDSLWDRAHILNGKPKRKFESIVDSLLAPFSETEKGALEAFVGFGIHAENFPHSFDDPTRGKDNEKMCRYITETWGKDCVVGEQKEGRLDISKITQRQFEKAGVKNVKIFSEVNPYTDERFWSNRRGDKERNLILLSFV